MRLARIAGRQDFGACIEREDFIDVPAGARGNALDLGQQRGIQIADQLAIARAQPPGADPVEGVIWRGLSPNVARPFRAPAIRANR